ncbi:hypothetical protein Gpo141_00011522 [Globisporangium polare]
MDQQQDYGDEYGSFTASDEYYAPVEDGSSANAEDPEYAAEYWRLDEEARVCFHDLAPDAFGESVPLGDLDELCRRMGRSIRDDSEQLRLMVELDTTNQMLILRHDFVAWLARDVLRERELENARLFVRENRAVPVAEPVWEEVALRPQPSAEDSSPVASFLNPEPTRFFYNVMTGESKWELPSFVQCLWDYVIALEAKRALTQSPADPLILLKDELVNNVEMLQDLRSLFTKYDDDSSGALDGTEFEDLCVAVGQSLTTGDNNNSRESVRELMRQVDPFSAQEVVSWDALSYYWVTNVPFQRRTQLDHEGFAGWERVDVLYKKHLPVEFRNSNTLVERWNHPEMEQNVVNLLLKLVPSTKLDWKKKIALFFQVQFENGATAGSTSSSNGDNVGGDSPQLVRAWDLSQCARVLSQLGHPMTRRRHLEAAIQQIHAKFAGASDTTAGSTAMQTLDEPTVTNWFQHSIRKVEMRGWEEMVEPASGQVYYYHEVSGLTQWDPPQMESQMTSFLSKFSGGTSGNASSDERITRIFRHYDLDESGSISLDEFQKFYRALLGASDSSSSSQAEELKIQQIFEVLDTGGDGSVSLDEFKLWWRTKLQLEEEETEDMKLQKRNAQRRELCLSFLENADALIMRSSLSVAEATGGGGDGEGASERPPDSQLVCFESNLLPRLVAVLGKYQLKGLMYRSALKELVKDALNQEVELEDFLTWYDAFEALGREKEEIEEAKAKAQAELQAQEMKAAARAKEKQMKGKRKLNKQQRNDEEARRKRIETLFKTFDANGSGFLDEKELQQLTKALGHEMDTAQVHQMMQVMDTSGDRQVSFDEFLTFWNAFQRQKSPVKVATKISTTTDPQAQGAATAKHRARGNRPSVIEASASLSVSLEMAKSRVLKFSLDDFKEALGDWKDELADKRNDRKKQQLADEKALEQKHKWSAAFIPTKKRRYAYFDVTWIEPEVVKCVVDMIQQITSESRPVSRPDAAQTIQKIAKGYVTRTLVFKKVEARFHSRVDLQTRFLYYEDCESGKVLLERPLYRAPKMSTVAPFELEDCDTKLQRYEFMKKQREMRAKQRFYEVNGFADASPFVLMKKSKGRVASGQQQQRSLFVPAAFYLYEVSQLVHKRLLGDIWIPLRQQKDLVLIELIATRYRRQLKQRSSDGASYLPLHYVVRHPQFPLRVVRAIVNGYSDARCERDAFGMTPLHLALRERRSSLDLLCLLIGKRNSGKPSVWEMKTKCGDTPLHVGVLHCAPIELMRWVLSSKLISIDTVCSLNAHGDSSFHIAIRQFGTSSSSSSGYSKAIIHTFFKNFDAERLCSFRTKQGDLPLHLAMDAFEKLKQRQPQLTSASSANEATSSGWVWLTRHLVTLFPHALLVRKADNGLLPVHLAIKYAFPTDFVREMWGWTLSSIEKKRQEMSTSQSTVLDWMMIAQTRTTLLHYAILYQPHALELVQSILEKMPEACSMKCIPNDDLPLHLVVSTNLNGSADVTGRSQVVRLLCERYVAGCQVYNRQGKLPIHLAISSGQSVDVIKILIESSPFVLTANKQERNGLRALILAASTKNPDYAVLSTLLELTPSVTITLKDVRKRPVTPLYAISLHPCHRNDGTTSGNQDEADTAAAAHRSTVLTKFSTNFEQIEDEDAYFLEMAKSKMRRKHHCPTAEWDYHQILRLIDLNPLDEAVLQRSFLAINNKLNALVEQRSEGNLDNNSGDVELQEQKKLSEAAVVVVALDPELLIVRRIHQIMYEFASNARVQVMGQGVLRKLLPTAFAKTAYKSKIDPYFNL